jgi:hypothetical protein
MNSCNIKAFKNFMSYFLIFNSVILSRMVFILPQLLLIFESCFCRKFPPVCFVFEDTQGWSNLNVRSSRISHNLHIKFLTILTHNFWNFSLFSHKISQQITLFQKFIPKIYELKFCIALFYMAIVKNQS